MGKRAAAVHVKRTDFANVTGRGSLTIPRNHPFAPRVDGYGRAVFLTDGEREEFRAKWNDSIWAERFGRLEHDYSMQWD